jgi:hypothetical protein
MRPPEKPGGPPGEAARDIKAPAKVLDAAIVEADADAAGELAAWAAAVVHLHRLGLPAACPPFPAAWLARRGISADWTAAA